MPGNSKQDFALCVRQAHPSAVTFLYPAGVYVPAALNFGITCAGASGADHRESGAGHRAPDANHRAPDADCRESDANHRAPDADCRAPDADYRASGANHWASGADGWKSTPMTQIGAIFRRFQQAHDSCLFPIGNLIRIRVHP
ncbi:MAG: hypothetical protein LBP50_02595 [Tannerella sp.]|nr:hypothetical protein [Tannerella sp.]